MSNVVVLTECTTLIVKGYGIDKQVVRDNEDVLGTRQEIICTRLHHGISRDLKKFQYGRARYEGCGQERLLGDAHLGL